MTASWARRTLGDVLSVQNGYAFDSKAFGATGFPLIRIRDLKSGVATETRYGAEFDLKYVVNAGDFLIGMDGEFGCFEWKGEPALLNQRVCRLQGFGDALEPRFLFHGINAHLKAIEEVTGYTTVKHLSSKQILGIEMLVPPRDEQRRIVAILDEAFEGIATAKANAERNLQNARELFESKLYVLLGQDVAGWPRKTLREVSVDFGRGKSKHRPRNDPKLYGGPYPFIQTGDVRGAEHLITKYTQTYSEAGLSQSKLWPRGTLCITIAANIAETGVLDFEACFPDSVIGVVVDESQTSSKYLEYMLRTVRAELKAKGKGSAQDNINLATFENERFPFPDLGSQARAVGVLDELSSEVQRLGRLYALKLSALDELKESVLRQAFAGELKSNRRNDLVEAVA